MGDLYGVTIDVNTPFFQTLTDDQAILVQALVLRLSTARGTYWDDPEYGLDLTVYANEGLTEDRLATIGLEIKAEVEKDERVSSAEVDLISTSNASGVVLEAAIRVTPTGEEDIEFKLAITDVTVELLTRSV